MAPNSCRRAHHAFVRSCFFFFFCPSFLPVLGFFFFCFSHPVKISKKEIARLLQDGKEEKARIKVEQVCGENFATVPTATYVQLRACMRAAVEKKILGFLTVVTTNAIHKKLRLSPKT